MCFLDAATSTANPARGVPPGTDGIGLHILNIDHTTTTPTSGPFNLVVPAASCTAEIIWDLMHALEVSPTGRSPTRCTWD